MVTPEVQGSKVLNQPTLLASSGGFSGRNSSSNSPTTAAVTDARTDVMYTSPTASSSSTSGAASSNVVKVTGTIRYAVNNKLGWTKEFLKTLAEVEEFLQVNPKEFNSSKVNELMTAMFEHGDSLTKYYELELQSFNILLNVTDSSDLLEKYKAYHSFSYETIQNQDILKSVLQTITIEEKELLKKFVDLVFKTLVAGKPYVQLS
jgi:hypothetical protein